MKTIKIEVVNGRIIVTPKTCRAKHKDQIQWKSALRFCVYFGYVSPLDAKIFYKKRPKGIVKYNAALYGPKKFKYIVGVCSNSEILIIDPELDIRPND